MLTVGQFKDTLKAMYTSIKFFNGCISKDEKCVGVYARGQVPPPIAIGTKSSYGILPVTLLVHYGENSDTCETVANTLYEGLENGIEQIDDVKVIQIQLLDSTPVNIGRDDKNICEMTIRLNIVYERN